MVSRRFLPNLCRTNTKHINTKPQTKAKKKSLRVSDHTSAWYSPNTPALKLKLLCDSMCRLSFQRQSPRIQCGTQNMFACTKPSETVLACPQKTRPHNFGWRRDSHAGKMRAVVQSLVCFWLQPRLQCKFCSPLMQPKQSRKINLLALPQCQLCLCVLILCRLPWPLTNKSNSTICPVE